ncbi:MAG: hypothetical protein JSS60_04795 [Verrucomicrobia bacterium]|nr:hypothetical protein [Verrucomicrobiota bacterium]
MAALDRIFSAIADYSKAMGSLHIDFLDIVRRDIDRFKEMTDKLYGQMQWQAWSVVALSSVGASLAIAGSLFPKGASAANPLSNTRLGANDGISDPVSKALTAIGDKLRDSEFMRSTCKTAAKTFNGISPAANVWWQSQTTDSESKRELYRLCFQEGQQEKGTFSQETRRAQESALSILQSKSKGG